MNSKKSTHYIRIGRTATRNGNASETKERRAWRDMKTRCYNNKRNTWSCYGGRGITVCNRWKDSFNNFFLDMGMAPSIDHSLDRINVNGNYEPGNCRWATHKVQMNNRRTNAIKNKQQRTMGMSAGLLY